MFGRQERECSIERHYYTSRHQFEESLDVYRPARAHPHLPVVLLVVGSGWMGHWAWIYRMTSWWNSSGPLTIARTGAICVAIRHPGAYFRIYPMYYIYALGCSIPVLMMMQLAWQWAIALECMIQLILVTLHVGGRDAASLDEMVHSVASATSWIRDNGVRLDLFHDKNEKFVFGGYSSGGHVAMTLLQRPKLLKRYNGWNDRRHLDDILSGVLVISGVLAVTAVDESLPTWLTDLVMTIVWGEQRSCIPSPIQFDVPTTAPILLIGNRKEVFGLSILDVFFCLKEFAKRLRSNQRQVVVHEVDSDHWNILASRDLQDVLTHELPRMKIPVDRRQRMTE